MFAFRRSTVILRSIPILRSMAIRGFADVAASSADTQEEGDPEVIDFIKKVIPNGTAHLCRLFERIK